MKTRKEIAVYIKAVIGGEYYHRHFHQIVVSRRELIYQLKSCWNQEDILRLLIYGRELPEYDMYLQKVSCRFEVIGSMVYPVAGFKTSKPGSKEYSRYLFDLYCDSGEEMSLRMEEIAGIKATGDEVALTCRRYRLIASECSRLLSQRNEIAWASEYAAVIDYALTVYPDNLKYRMIGEDYESKSVWK